MRVAYEHEARQWHNMQLDPGDMRASFLEVDSDQVNDFTGNWHPAGGLGWESSVNTETTEAFLGVELQGPDPKSLAQHWSHVLGLQVQALDASPYIALANAKIRFVADRDGRGPGLSGVDLKVKDPAEVVARAQARGCPTGTDNPTGNPSVELCGTKFYLS